MYWMIAVIVGNMILIATLVVLYIKKCIKCDNLEKELKETKDKLRSWQLTSGPD